MVEPKIIIEYLKWDSDFFNLKVGKINYNPEKKEWLVEAITKSDFDLIYIFNQTIYEIPPTIIEKCSLKLVDTKVVYSKNLQDESPEAECLDISHYSEKDYKQFLFLALESGHTSRFKLDNNFNANSFEKLYKEWVDKSLDKIIADKVFSYLDGGEILGFVTLKFKKDIATIGLIAVAPDARGKKIGEKLMNRCFYESQKNNCKTLNVATQKENVGACRFYEKLNMTVIESTKIYHYWKK